MSFPVPIKGAGPEGRDDLMIKRVEKTSDFFGVELARAQDRLDDARRLLTRYTPKTASWVPVEEQTKQIQKDLAKLKRMRNDLQKMRARYWPEYHGVMDSLMAAMENEGDDRT